MILIPADDLPEEEYAKIVKDVYTPMRDKPVEVEVTAIAADGGSVVLLLNNPRCCEKEKPEEGKRGQGEGG